VIPVYIGAEAEVALRRLTLADPELTGVIQTRVREIIDTIRQEGETGLRAIASRLGDPTPERFELFPAEVATMLAAVPLETQRILERAAANIHSFGQAVMQSVQPVRLATDFGMTGLDWRPVERVACYVPGGRFPLPSTALMTAITAQVAGVKEIAILSPDLRPETIAAGTLAGVTRFFRLGGAQAVAASAYGVGGMFRADMLVGPGNAYVTEAKRQLQGVIGIDMLAGPSEVAILADEGANPAWLAADLLAQAEHDEQACAYLFTWCAELAVQVGLALEEIIRTQPELSEHLRQNDGHWGAIFILPNLAACIAAVNELAPEHLELMVADPAAVKPELTHYGALFMGYHTPVPVGDYLAGPNHTLPTARSARFSGTLNPLTFLRPQSWMERRADSHAFIADVAAFAHLEGLEAHALSARCRLP
jgi:histidinol dehydrogenase